MVLAMICWYTIVYVAATSKAFVYGSVPVEMRGPVLFYACLVFEIYSKGQAVVNIIWDLMFVTIKTLVTNHWTHSLQLMLKWLIVSFIRFEIEFKAAFFKCRLEVKLLRLQVREFKVLSILICYLNSSYSAAKIPLTMGILLTLLVTSFYGLIQFFGKMSPSTYIMFPIVVNNCMIISLLVLVPGAKLYKSSERYFQKIKGVECVGKVIRREAKCIRIFGIRFGFLRAIRHPHIANYFLALSNYTLSLLVAFPTFE